MPPFPLLNFPTTFFPSTLASLALHYRSFGHVLYGPHVYAILPHVSGGIILQLGSRDEIILGPFHVDASQHAITYEYQFIEPKLSQSINTEGTLVTIRLVAEGTGCQLEASYQLPPTAAHNYAAKLHYAAVVH